MPRCTSLEPSRNFAWNLPLPILCGTFRNFLYQSVLQLPKNLSWNFPELSPELYSEIKTFPAPHPVAFAKTFPPRTLSNLSAPPALPGRLSRASHSLPELPPEPRSTLLLGLGKNGKVVSSQIHIFDQCPTDLFRNCLTFSAYIIKDKGLLLQRQSFGRSQGCRNHQDAAKTKEAPGADFTEVV